MSSNIIVIGGGASGLVAAIEAARNQANVTIVEHKEKFGKKILATGNGKCNYTNYVQTADCYRGTNPSFALKVLEQFDVNRTVDFFRQLGIVPKVRNGYVYPASSQAASVLDVLLLEAGRLGVKMIANEHVTEITKKGEKFRVRVGNQNVSADKVILATGGMAASKLGSDGSGYTIAKSFGHKIITPMPALVQLKSNAKFLKTINGVRTEAAVQVMVGNKPKAGEKGEILFTNYGISGIPVMQLSRFAAEGLAKKQSVQIVIDFTPDLSISEVKEQIKQRLQTMENRTAEELLIGWFNHKLTYILLKNVGIDPEKRASKIKPELYNQLCKLIKEFPLQITDTNGFENAQTSAGGVATDEINPSSMESKLVRGLYFAGELVDIDGTCGGYNLQWAWSSGYVAGTNASRVK